MRIHLSSVALVAGLGCLMLQTAGSLRAQESAPVKKIVVGMGKTFVLECPANIEKIAVTSDETAQAVPADMRTVLINGKSSGETSLLVWLSDGTRTQYDVVVTYSATRMEAAKLQLQQEFGGKVHLAGDMSGVYLTGTVPDSFGSARAELIAESVGKVVNLLKSEVPRQEQEIMLRIRFADVDRSKSSSFGFNIIGAPNGIPFNVTTGANSSPRFSGTSASPTFTLTDALNVLMFDPHLNVGATLQALQANNVLQILAEPNLTTMNGVTASFTAGGEFPFPTVASSGGVSAPSVSFREFGIKLKFTPTVTPRGTIRLKLSPEVSSLDYANALTLSGSTVPALNTRKLDTEVELEFGQSFAIAGLLDQRTTEALSKIPGLSEIPLLGKLFQSRTVSKSNSELIVIVTPELVAAIPKDQALPDLQRPLKFLDGPGVMTEAPRNPGLDKTGPAPERPVRTEMPVQELQKYELEQKALHNSSDTGATIGAAGGAGSGSSGNSVGAGMAPAPVYPTSTPLAMPALAGPNKVNGQ